MAVPTPAANADYQLSFDDIIYEKNTDRPRLIGRGGFGDVYAAMHNGERVALKELRVSRPLDAAQLAKFWDEVRIHYKLHHDNIVPIHGAAVLEESNSYKYAIVLQRMKGSLHDLLHGTNRKPLTLRQRLKILLQVARAMRFVHGRHIVHGDLKPGNVLLDFEDNARVSDFGEAKMRPPGGPTLDTHTRPRGTWLYMAPELHNRTGSLTAACDVFSFGILMHEVLTGWVPYAELNFELESDLSKHVIEGGRPNIDLLEVGEATKVMRQLVVRCGDKTAANRPSMMEVEEVISTALDTVANTGIPVRQAVAAGEPIARAPMGGAGASPNPKKPWSWRDAATPALVKERMALFDELSTKVEVKAGAGVPVGGAATEYVTHQAIQSLFSHAIYGTALLLHSAELFSIVANTAVGKLRAAEFLLLLHVAAKLGDSDDEPLPTAPSTEDVIAVDTAIKAYNMSVGSDSDGNTALHWLVAQGDSKVTMVRKLLAKPVNPNAANGKGERPLHCAAGCGAMDIIAELLQAGANVNAEDKQGKTPLDVALMASPQSARVLQTLKNAGGTSPFNTREAVRKAQEEAERVARVEAERKARVELQRKAQEEAERKARVEAERKAKEEAERIARDNANRRIREESQTYISVCGGSINSTNSVGQTAIFNASRDGRKDIAEWLLNNGADVNKADNDARTPLYVAAYNGQKDVVLLLLDRGADVNKADKDESTPLLAAAQNGHSDVVLLLLNRGADANKANMNGVTPLYMAAFNGHKAVTLLLLNHGADVNKAHNDGWTPLYVSAQKGQRDAALILLDHGADVNKADKDGSTPLLAAVQNGHKDVVLLLLNRGFDINKANKNGVTPLYMAAFNGLGDAALILMNHGADVNKADKDGSTPLLAAAQNGHKDLVLHLLDRGADANKANTNGVTPLYMAAFNGHKDVALLLLDHGANVNKAHTDGFTPLYAAAYRGHKDIVALLLERGADVNKAHKDGGKPLQIATQSGHTEIAQMLRNKGAR